MDRKLTKREDNVFVPVYNKFLSNKKTIDYNTGEIKENTLSLTPDELYIYFWLHAHRNYRTNTTLISVDSISYLIKLYSKRDKKLREDKNKDCVKKIIVALKNKKIIFYEKENDFSYSEPLDIAFYSDIEGGYQEVRYDIFQMTDKPKEFFILCCILALKRKISYSELALRMGLSDKTVKDIIKKMSNNDDMNRLINKYPGKYYKDKDGNIKQEANFYEVRNNTVNILVEDRKHNWYNWKADLDYNDYEIYKTTKDKKLIEMAEKRIKAICKSKPNFFENWERKYQKEYEKQTDLKRMYDNTDMPTIDTVNSSDNLFNDSEGVVNEDWDTTYDEPDTDFEDKETEEYMENTKETKIPKYFTWNGEEYNSQQLMLSMSYKVKQNIPLDEMENKFIEKYGNKPGNIS